MNSEVCRRDLTIDREFLNLIPAISDDERKHLESNVIEFGGARDPLVVWRDGDRDTLLDGHNRYEICTRLGLPFTVHPVEFNTRDEAADWIDRNQLGRRNLSKQDYTLLVGRRYNRARKSRGAPEGNDNRAEINTGKKSTLNTTAKKLGREHGVDEKTVRRAGKFQAAAQKLGIEEDIAAGKVKASAAEIIKAADSLPGNAVGEQIEHARESVKASASKHRKSKEGDKASASEARRKNAQLGARITKGVISLSKAVEKLAETDSIYREQALAELQRCVGHLSAALTGSPAKSEKTQPTDELRAAVRKRWETMRLWGNRWSLADMKDVRKLFVEIIRDEQKQFDKCR